MRNQSVSKVIVARDALIWNYNNENNNAGFSNIIVFVFQYNISSH